MKEVTPAFFCWEPGKDLVPFEHIFGMTWLGTKSMTSRAGSGHSKVHKSVHQVA